ncbi:MAG: phosphoenolpyruvate--protein phosphotransferase [Syntrophobacterales bacterium]|nr:phosphoenolpyruvate--protein phosphotransferase [Syntrophobacterales bacterium]
MNHRAMEEITFRLKGVGVSQGIAIGKAFVVQKGPVSIPYYTLWSDEAIEEECQRFEEAVRLVEEDLFGIKEGLKNDLRQYASLLDAYRLMLRDRLIYDGTLSLIREKQLNALWALSLTLSKAREIFDGQDRFADRFYDIGSVIDRLMRKLSGGQEDIFSLIRERSILVTHDLSPSDAAQLPLEKVMAFVLDIGGKTSHTAIIARSLNIPAVMATEQASKKIQTGDLLIVDGTSGQVIINPSEEDIQHYIELQLRLDTYLRDIAREASLPAVTRDGFRVVVEANIELLEEIVTAKDNGADGIGLFRTEFGFMNRDDLPTEEELYQEYKQLAELMAPGEVIIRTLDVGSDKLSAWFPPLHEPNPALGLRSVRFCLRHPEIMKIQMKAILRTGAIAGNVKMMFPLISGIGEWRAVKKILREAQEELWRFRIPFDENMPIGIMVEVPSAVAIADLLAREVDFFSIGTNDLIQYALAIDRQNEHVAHLFEALHPAILRMLHFVVREGHRAGISVSLCGEMAGEPFYVPILLGLGFDKLSMNPQSIPRVKNLIRRSSKDQCEALVKEVLRKDTAEDIRGLLMETVEKQFPEEYHFFHSGFVV